jgi:hypothetical protein
MRTRLRQARLSPPVGGRFPFADVNGKDGLPVFVEQDKVAANPSSFGFGCCRRQTRSKCRLQGSRAPVRATEQCVGPRRAVQSWPIALQIINLLGKRMQASLLIAALAEDRPDDLAEAYHLATSEGAKWKARIEASLRRIPDADKLLKRVAAACGFRYSLYDI